MLTGRNNGGFRKTFLLLLLSLYIIYVLVFCVFFVSLNCFNVVFYYSFNIYLLTYFYLFKITVFSLISEKVKWVVLLLSFYRPEVK